MGQGKKGAYGAASLGRVRRTNAQLCNFYAYRSELWSWKVGGGEAGPYQLLEECVTRYAARKCVTVTHLRRQARLDPVALSADGPRRCSPVQHCDPPTSTGAIGALLGCALPART